MLDFLFQKNNTCRHEKVSTDSGGSYCPDCGKYVINEWYISRCKCCGVKQKTIIIQDRIKAQVSFCKNCGNNRFYTEKVEKINFIDINYATIQKRAINNARKNFTQIWEEKGYQPIKLLCKSLT